MSGGRRPGGSEPASCILCGDAAARQVHAREKWRYLQCSSCGLVSLWPRPSAEGILQSYEEYLPLEPREVHAWETMMAPVIRASGRIIESRSAAAGRRVLDIGCGYGFFLREMSARGWIAEGVEISPAGRAYAEGRLGLKVHGGPLEAMGLPEHAFDVVTLFYVIEHLIDPVGLLREVWRILKPGGMVLLRWPHSTPIVRILGPVSRRMDLYHTPYHLYDFSPRTIRHMLNLCGFQRVETLIGGYTRPKGLARRAAARAFAGLGEGLLRISRGAALLPGVSKTTLAFKSREMEERAGD